MPLLERWLAPLLTVALFTGCKPRDVADAEAKHDAAWLGANGSPEAMAALGRLADKDNRAITALEARADRDVNVYIAAWTAVTRNAAWGTTFLRTALADPTRAELAATALPHRDPRLGPFATDLEGAVVRLAAGRSGSSLAGVLASIGPGAHAPVERRLLDPKTRGAMCAGAGFPDASGDAKSLLLAVPPEGRDHAACVTVVLDMAAVEDVVLGWLATGAEPGLLTAMGKGSLACPRVAQVWQKALPARSAESMPALTVPLAHALRRCAATLDPVCADLLTSAPRARSTILQAIDPFNGDAGSLKATCKAIASGWAAGESPVVRDRAADILTACKVGSR